MGTGMLAGTLWLHWRGSLLGDGEAGMALAEGLTLQILSDIGIDPGHV